MAGIKENIGKVILAALVIILYFIIKAVIWNSILVCPFHSITGLYCPGCGGIRSISFLVQGNIPAALKCNLLVVLSLITFPVLLIFVSKKIKKALSYGSDFNIKTMVLILAITLIFTVIRNITDYPFINLRP